MGGAPEEMASFKVFDEEDGPGCLEETDVQDDGCLGSRPVEEAARNSRVPKLLMSYSIG